ncbi:hypothetical protein [Flavobacterium psychrophilum]|uniref:Uncharacterized protein n=1 Tax=Flavobacterium psychrophilum TaxID=96345 RepID=A0A7U2NEH0_FLAPS|nr:hypothetical protein [Flavobacterium psychrophilum]QRE03555.1 hypothetical protein H0H26_11795 [Flavobacterium psychrophilum]
MIDYKKYLPYPSLPIRVKTKYGISEAILSEVGYRYTNLENPLQNAHLSHFDILEWEYVDIDNMNSCFFIENVYQRRQEAEELLNNIKISFLDRIRFFFLRHFW